MQVSLRSYSRQQDVHVHAFDQAVLPIEGTMDIKVGGVAGSVSARQGVIIASGTRHVFRACGSNRFVVLDARSADFRSMALRSPFFGLDEGMTRLISYADHELRSGELGVAGTMHLAALITAKIRQRFPAPARWSDPVERAVALMRQRHAERLPMAEVASAAGPGVSRLYELFRRETGQTPAEVLANIRLDRAEDLLRGTPLPIAEIALLVGFSEQSALTRSFRRRRGTTPHTVRHAHADQFRRFANQSRSPIA